jgi:hypothetical protein
MNPTVKSWRSAKINTCKQGPTILEIAVIQLIFNEQTHLAVVYLVLYGPSPDCPEAHLQGRSESVMLSLRPGWQVSWLLHARSLHW